MEKSAPNRAAGEKAFDTAIYIIASVILAIVLYPLVFIVSASFSDPGEVVAGHMWLWPKGWSVQSYKLVFENGDVWRGYLNTIVYAVVGVCVNLVMTVLAAYPLSRQDLPGRNVFMFGYVFTMFFSGGLIPTYLVVRDLGLVNTMWALIVPTAIATFNLIIMRTFFQTIPVELQESASMDGCTNGRLLLSVVLPLSKPILAVMLLYYGVAHWNSFFNALIYLNDHDKYPLQLILREILIQNQATADLNDPNFADRIMMAESIKYALIVVASIPVLLLYPFVQRYFVQGVMIGAIKG
ncbi:ABC transporter permease subunit [Cohnella zeiphila]|uniref:Carbohydrate ABC transporter permease n=1 Tax=Cohnella zeiphila TaxID=2761120 RepID=A0A7X0VWR4_9BACL|nr:carbohydrate ABC transporter permease [Cohnella zeiphila]